MFKLCPGAFCGRYSHGITRSCIKNKSPLQGRRLSALSAEIFYIQRLKSRQNKKGNSNGVTFKIRYSVVVKFRINFNFSTPKSQLHRSSKPDFAKLHYRFINPHTLLAVSSMFPLFTYSSIIGVSGIFLISRKKSEKSVSPSPKRS